MAKAHQRFFALFLALLFLATSSAVTIAVIVQIQRDRDIKKQNEDLAKVTEQLQNNPPTEVESVTESKLDNFTPVAQVDSLQKIDLVPGDGAEATSTSTVTAHYTGALAKDGTIFETSKTSGQPATFPISGVIKGWQEGVPGMKVGGTRRLIIPASMAYGEQGSPPKIGPNEPLVFDIELISVQ